VRRLVLAGWLALAVGCGRTGWQSGAADAGMGDGGGPPPGPCATSAIVVSMTHDPYGDHTWNIRRSAAAMQPDGLGGVFVTWRAYTATDIWDERWYLEHFDRHGQRQLGTYANPREIAGPPLAPGSGDITADGDGGLYATVTIQDATLGRRRSEIQHFDANTTPLWPAAPGEFGPALLDDASANGEQALWAYVTSLGDLAVYFSDTHFQAWLQIIDPNGQRSWPGGRALLSDLPYAFDPVLGLTGGADGDGGAWYTYDAAGDIGDGTLAPITVYARHYARDGQPVFPDPGLVVAGPLFSRGMRYSMTDGVDGLHVVYGSRPTPIGTEEQSWPEALYASRVSRDGELVWGSGVPLTTTMKFMVCGISGGPTPASCYTTFSDPAAIWDGRGGLYAAWHEDRGDGVGCYGQYVSPAGEALAPDGVRLEGGAEMFCAQADEAGHFYSAGIPPDGQPVFPVVENPFDTPGHGRFWRRVAVQKLGPDLTARWGEQGVTLLECPDELPLTWGVIGVDGFERVLGDDQGGVFVLWSMGDNGGFLYLQHVTADGRLDWTGP
jgi:hypothetical protein